MACSALSLPFYGYFYCFCLLHIVIDNDILQRVLKSVTKNGEYMKWSMLFKSICTYRSFAVVGGCTWTGSDVHLQCWDICSSTQ